MSTLAILIKMVVLDGVSTTLIKFLKMETSLPTASDYDSSLAAGAPRPSGKPRPGPSRSCS